MSDINSSLIGFLKKKSLFSDSPGKSLRLQDRPREQSNLIGTPTHAQDNNFSSPSERRLRKQSPKHYQSGSESEPSQHSLQDWQPRFSTGPQLSPQVGTKESASQPRRNFNFGAGDESKSLRRTREEDSNVWTGLVNYSSSFESARIESAQCLEGMSHKIQSQLSNINYKMDVFHSKMSQILAREFAAMKDKIYAIVNKVFQESEQHIRAYVKQQEQVLAGELLHMRDALAKQYQKVQSMKDEISGPSWRKVAGELLSSEMEQKVNSLLYKSRSIDVGHWEVGDLGQSKVASLENNLREMIRLTSK